MARGFSKEVLDRCWSVVEYLQTPKSLDQIKISLNMSERLTRDTLRRLSQLKIVVKYARKEKLYTCEWPKKTTNLTLTPAELFSIHYLNLEIDGFHSEDMVQRIEKSIFNSDPVTVVDSQISRPLSDSSEPLPERMEAIKSAIIDCRVCAMTYQKEGQSEELLLVHPALLYHTPLAWYLIAFCTERKEHVWFQYSNIKTLKFTDFIFEPIAFDLKNIINKDAWWVENGPRTHKIKVLLTGEAGKAISNYRYHPSQKVEEQKHGCIATWELSSLTEFSMWLMQWMGEIEIIAPPELRTIINNRIQNFLEKNSK